MLSTLRSNCKSLLRPSLGSFRRSLRGSTRLFSSAGSIKVDNPFTGDTYCEVPLLTGEEADEKVSKAATAQEQWALTSIDERIALCERFLKAMQSRGDQIAADITGMMGKPVQFGQGEINGMTERAEAMMSMAHDALADDILPEKDGFFRTIRHEPVGVVLCIAPWNYPLLTAVNCIVPAILSGNSVLLKHSSRTPLCADHFIDAFNEAGAPEGLIQTLHASHSVTADVMMRQEVGYAHFTGSVGAGHTIYQQAARRFIDVGLELGGKDPAYIADDANLEAAIESVVDGGLFNAGQSCCGIERVYVARQHYEAFLEGAHDIIKKMKLDDPMSGNADMGPLADPKASGFLKKQVDEAVSMGARLIAGGSPTTVNGKGRFFQPTLIADCTHDMNIMVEESFGPIVAVAPVDNDQEAIEKINDSPYGLTVSLWTQDEKRAMNLAKLCQTGTVFMNRCDYLDPELAWTGVKDTGKGVSLSKHGFGPLTRLKSIHFKSG